ncbi:Vignain, partial [Ananas comosus]
MPLMACGTTLDPMRERYEQWISRYSRVYKDKNEKEQRFRIYESNVQLIDIFNTISEEYKLIDNKFADLTSEEFKAKSVCLRDLRNHRPSSLNFWTSMNCVSPGRISDMHEKKGSSVPSSIDWREKGAVTLVRDQGECGSCWAFSTVAAVEGINKIKAGRLVALSVQELVDCDTQGANSGCRGGFMTQAFDFILRNHGLTSESDYPYQGVEGACETSKLSNHVATISGYKNVTPSSEQSLLKAVAAQPVSVAIDAGGFAFQFYSKGIFTGPCGSDLNHGVAVVGYGTAAAPADQSNEFWIVKNSWGADWGEKGYIRMKRSIPTNEACVGLP